jgi:membrane-bound lytic murein transglycosylase B
MKNPVCWLLVIVCLLGGALSRAETPESQQDFTAWLTDLRVEALAAGISPETLDKALSTIEAPREELLEQDRNQPEKVQSLTDYVSTRVSEKSIADGRFMLRHYATWLGRIEKRYGVQRRFIVALWGIESSYGQHTGRVPVIQALVTLAYDGRRGSYFRKELLEALRILDDGPVTMQRMQGSWAGAMGHFQFMPSSYWQYAVDADGDGRSDIWNSIPDALASAANYLARNGWNDKQTWGRPVRLPRTFDASLAGLETRLSLSRWQAVGVRRSNGGALPRSSMLASLIIPEGPSGQAFLVYDNFRTLRRWNRSNAFAVAVGTLADRIVEQN